MITIGVIGLGKMGLSHLAMLRSHPEVRVVAVVDSARYLLDILHKYIGVPTFSDVEEMLDSARPDAVVVATPTRFHSSMVRISLERGVDVFCEKPLSLSTLESDQLSLLAASHGLVTQVGYHNRFVGAFREVRRLLDHAAIGRVTHILAEAYGPVVLRPKGTTWRSQKSEGGGSLYDYAAHPVDLMTWYLGAPSLAAGTALQQVFSEQTEDQVFSSLFFPGGVTGQVSVDWSDESRRKMTTMVNVWGTRGQIYADRQECRTYLRDPGTAPPGYRSGWNTRHITELTESAWFYLRGEEYSAQLDHFIQRVATRQTEGVNTFGSAAITDHALELMALDASRPRSASVAPLPEVSSVAPARHMFRRNR